jgi:hypothetical protein
MKFKCRPVTLEFFDHAPVRFINEVELAASPDTVFAIFEQAEAWPQCSKKSSKWIGQRPGPTVLGQPEPSSYPQLR